MTHDVTPENYKFREEDPSKFLGNAAIVIRSFKNEKDRIKEAQAQHKYFSSGYSNLHIDFRPRDRSKDIQPEMHFRSRPNIERIATKLEQALKERSVFTHYFLILTFFQDLAKNFIDRNDPLIVALRFIE